MAVAPDLAQREAAPVTHSPWTCPQCGIDESARQQATSYRLQDAGTARTQGLAFDPQQQLPKDVSVGARSRLGHDDLLTPADMIAHTDGGKHQVKLLALECCRGRQDDMRVARGFIDVVVDGDAELQGGQCLIYPSALRDGEHGIAGDQHHGTDLTLARCEDFIRQRGGGELRGHLGDPSHSGAPAVVPGEIRREGTNAREVECGLGKHPAAHLIQPPGEDVERVDEPVGRRAELGLAHTEPRVDSSASSTGKITRKPPNRLRIHAGLLLHGLRREVRHHRGNRRHAINEGVCPSGIDQSLVKEHMDHRCQQEDIGAGTDEDMLVSDIGRLCPTRIDHDDPSAPLAKPLKASLDVGRRHDRAIRNDGIAPDHEEVIGAIDIRHGQQQG